MISPRNPTLFLEELLPLSNIMTGMKYLVQLSHPHVYVHKTLTTRPTRISIALDCHQGDLNAERRGMSNLNTD